MKVLFVIDSLIKGGKERRLVELVKGFYKKKIEFKIVLLTPIIEFDELKELGIEPLVIKRLIKKDPLVFFKLLNILRDFKPDIVNTWGLMPSFYVFPLKFFLKFKFVNSMIIDSPRKLDIRTKILSKPIFYFSDIIASNSYSGLESYSVRSKNTAVIRNGFDFSRVSYVKNSEEVKNELGIAIRFIVGMVAAFRYHKDYETLIKAAKKITAKRKDIAFVLVGDGPTLEASKKLAASDPAIIFTGKRSDVEAIISACDICVLSTYTEGISNSIMEYMALGKPVVATAGGGTKELVDDGVTGILIPARSPDIFAQKIEFLIGNKELRDKMGASGKEKVIKDFSIEKMVTDYISLFKKVSGTI